MRAASGPIRPSSCDADSHGHEPDRVLRAGRDASAAGVAVGGAQREGLTPAVHEELQAAENLLDFSSDALELLFDGERLFDLLRLLEQLFETCAHRA